MNTLINCSILLALTIAQSANADDTLPVLSIQASLQQKIESKMLEELTASVPLAVGKEDGTAETSNSNAALEKSQWTLQSTSRLRSPEYCASADRLC